MSGMPNFQSTSLQTSTFILRTLVESMPRHVAVVIKAREAATRYYSGVSNLLALQCITLLIMYYIYIEY